MLKPPGCLAIVATLAVGILIGGCGSGPAPSTASADGAVGPDPTPSGPQLTVRASGPFSCASFGGCGLRVFLDPPQPPDGGPVVGDRLRGVDVRMVMLGVGQALDHPADFGPVVPGDHDIIVGEAYFSDVSSPGPPEDPFYSEICRGRVHVDPGDARWVVQVTLRGADLPCWVIASAMRPPV
jgi:hypothetical protein